MTATFLQTAASLPEVPRVPAPWALRGHGWIVVMRLPRHAAARTAFVHEQLRGSVRAVLSTLVCVEYTTAPCGAYREVLFIPGAMRFPDGHRHASISRILVSTWASVVNGRANWGIPKDKADFTIERGAACDRFCVSDAGRECCRVEFETARGPRLPLSTAWLPARWTTLAQVHDTNAYFYRPLARGSLRPARLLRWAFDAERFPDLVDATVLVAMRVEDFTMEFPVAQVLTTTGELAQ